LNVRYLNQKLMFPCGLLMMSFASMGASAAVLEWDGEVPVYHVNYADLDLSHRAGADALFARIKSAARRVCEPVAKSEPYRLAQTRGQSCIDKAIADAVAGVGSPLLTDVYLGRASIIKIAQK
jgi:UrcA family protein